MGARHSTLGTQRCPRSSQNFVAARNRAAGSSGFASAAASPTSVAAAYTSSDCSGVRSAHRPARTTSSSVRPAAARGAQQLAQAAGQFMTLASLCASGVSDR